MLESLKQRVCDANIELSKRGVVLYTWGNVSEIDRKTGLVVIKPSGVGYEEMTSDDMVVVELQTGKVAEGSLKPSSDTPTHLELYRAFADVSAITHTHSTYATVFAQAGKSIPALGTTHADYFYGDVPCTRELREEEVRSEYELNTGKVITETLNALDIDPMSIPGILVKNHGPFTWGSNASESVYHAVVLEKVAEMAFMTLRLSPESAMAQYVLDKHYTRKHGSNAYYGQN